MTLDIVSIKLLAAVDRPHSFDRLIRFSLFSIIRADTVMAFKVFKRRSSSYHAWQEDIDGVRCTDTLLESETDADVYPSSRKIPTVSEETDSTTYGSVGIEERVLLDCFYLGSFNMTGKTVTGRGCIDEPAAQIWRHTQEECKARRKNSMPLELIECKPKYVRLVSGKDHLKIIDQYSEQNLLMFSHRCISFTGTHHKYTKMFCFIAWEPKDKTPYCHAFKCEDSLSAKAGALNLSNIFKRKSREMLSQSSSPRHTLRKTKSLQRC